MVNDTPETADHAKNVKALTQHDRTIATRQSWLIVDMHDGRHDIGQRFAAARLSDANQIAAAQCDRPALGLDGRGLFEAKTMDLTHRVLGKAALVELYQRRRHIAPLYGDLMLAQEALVVGRRPLCHRLARTIKVLLEWDQLKVLPADATQAVSHLRIAR